MSVDVDYLKNSIGRCLVDGLTEVAELRPVDPVNFLAHWIYRYKEKLNEEEKREKERAQLEQERKEALLELERLGKLKVEECLIAQKSAEQQKTFSAQYPTNTIAELTGKYGAPNLPTVEETDENSFIKEAKAKDVNIPEENETIESKQDVLENAQDQVDLNVMKNKLNEMPAKVTTIITFQETPGQTAVDADLNRIPKVVIDNEDENQPDHYEINENEYDTQSEDDTPDEEYKSSHPDLNSKY